MGSDAKLWISAIASCARRFGRNPYEHGLKSASKIGSSTSFRLAWTTRSVMVGIPSLRSFPLFFGISTRRTSTGPNSPDFIESRRASALVSGHAFPRNPQERRIINEVEQVTETTTRVPGRPQMQFGLHPRYRLPGREQPRPVHGTGIHRRILRHYSPFPV